MIGALSVLIISAVWLIVLMVSGREDSVDERMDRVSEQKPRKDASFTSADFASARLPKMGAMLMPADESKASKLKARLRQAGLYRRHSSALYLGVKLVFMVAPMGVGVVLSVLGLTSLLHGVVFGAVVGLVGNLLPSLWLNHLKNGRQKKIRRALPDALDVIIVCLEGGLSLPAALAKVTSELKAAHSLLADELAIVGREIQLGRSTGEALKQLADRVDAEELRSLASVVVQAERFGASVVKAFRVHADSLRLRRYQYAEAQAQKAPVKLIFPTVLCIFPALYIILMGPAGVQLLDMLSNLTMK